MPNLLEDLTKRDLDPSDLSGRDPEFIARVGRPFCRFLRDVYFRVDHEGIENLPREAPFIAIANHSGGPMLPDVWPIFGTWWELFPLEQPAYALVHDAAFRVPVVRNALIKLGALRASRENAEKVLEAGGVLLMFPGGDPEALRSFWKRNTIDFRSHGFFVELALRHGAPILPVVNVGGAETAITLLSSERLARWTGMRALAKVKRVPINVGLPWGLWATAFLPFLPLPAKISYKVGEPIALPRAPDLAEDSDYVGKRYQEIVDVMQGMVDDLAAHRRFPVIG